MRYFMLGSGDEVLMIIAALSVLVLWNIQVILCCGNAIALHTNVTLLSSISVVSDGACTIFGGPNIHVSKHFSIKINDLNTFNNRGNKITINASRITHSEDKP